ncbi:MAG: hypothetical protein QOK11_220 [Pseudonocardiales bacterium]|jgi:hypothetical protein|nr:hypothetical protein [Pseudonocardiales bacterium]MDT4946152.1 hypothetical protein [Pseudonocardiales bacterium]
MPGRADVIESAAVPRRRIRRPLLALVALLIALALGYGIRALQRSQSAPLPAPRVSCAAAPCPSPALDTGGIGGTGI